MIGLHLIIDTVQHLGGGHGETGLKQIEAGVDVGRHLIQVVQFAGVQARISSLK